MSVVQVSFLLQAKQYAALENRARAASLRPSEYARQLYEAAFLARVMDERGEETGDAALDRMVKQAFLLADCDPEFIAKAIGAPETWVKTILAGWRAYARGHRPQAAAPAPSPQAVAMGEAPVADEAAKSVKWKQYSDTEIATIRRLWVAEWPLWKIAQETGRPLDGFKSWVQAHRDICPRRR